MPHPSTLWRGKEEGRVEEREGAVVMSPCLLSQVQPPDQHVAVHGLHARVQRRGGALGSRGLPLRCGRP